MRSADCGLRTAGPVRVTTHGDRRMVMVADKRTVNNNRNAMDPGGGDRDSAISLTLIKMRLTGVAA